MGDKDRTKEQFIEELVEVHPGVLVLQLNGKRDRQTMSQLRESLAERITEANSSVVLVDSTDMPTVNTQMAQHLIDIISVVRRLGAQVILTGIRPSIDRKLARLSADLSGITSYSSLVAGLWAALDVVELEVANKTNTVKG